MTKPPTWPGAGAESAPGSSLAVVRTIGASRLPSAKICEPRLTARWSKEPAAAVPTSRVPGWMRRVAATPFGRVAVSTPWPTGRPVSRPTCTLPRSSQVMLLVRVTSPVMVAGSSQTRGPKAGAAVAKDGQAVKGCCQTQALASAAAPTRCRVRVWSARPVEASMSRATTISLQWLSVTVAVPMRVLVAAPGLAQLPAAVRKMPTVAERNWNSETVSCSVIQNGLPALS